MAEEEITFNAVEKDGHVSAIWEMQGKKHIRTIDPRSAEGRRILGTHTAGDEPHDTTPQSNQAE